MKRSLLLVSLLGVAPFGGFAEGQTNLALNRPWTATPSMGRHPATTNGQEYRKLTNGKRAEKALWESKEEAVGWTAGRTPIQVTLDLGSRRPISGIGVGCGAGMALDTKRIYYWPGVIDIFVSDDNQGWHYLGELNALNDAENAPLPAFNGQYVYRNISTNSLKASGRYVRLVFNTRAEVFLDEVEVYQGDESFLALKKAGKPLNDDGILKISNRTDPTLLVVKRRYRMDIAAIGDQLSNLEEAKAAPIRAELEKLKKETAAYNDNPANKRAEIPVGELGARILAQQAAVWRAQGKPPITLWQQGLWDHLYWMTPPPAPAQPKLEIALIRNEHRSTSFNLTNASDKAQTFVIKVSDLPGNGENLEIRATRWSEQVDRTATALALVPAVKVEDGYEITIPAGTTSQVWLTLLGSGDAGKFTGKVSVNSREQGLASYELPITVHLFAYTFPEKQALHFSGWDYITSPGQARYGLTPKNLPAAHKLLKDYKLDVNWSPVTSLDRGKFNDQHEYGSSEDLPKTDKFEEWVKTWPDAHRYYVNIAAFNKDIQPRIMGLDHKDDPEGFFKRVTTWLTFWEKKVKEMGIDPKRVALLIVDEPGLHGPNQTSYDNLIAVWVEAIKRSGTSFTQWMDPVYDEPWAANQANMDAMDEICVKYAHLIIKGEKYVNYYKERAAKQQLSLYECYPIVGGFDPYSYYRLMAWMSWSMNGNAVGIWSVADAGRDAPFGSWNNGLSPLNYSPLFFEKSQPEVYAGKGIEGLREGIYDYQYLTMLRDAIAEAKAKKADAEAIAAAERLLESAPRRVLWENKALQEPKWLPSTRIDRSIADQVRLEVLQTLDRLNR